MAQRIPTIKGLFFNSHVKAVRAKVGGNGVKQLEESLGFALSHSNSDDIPVTEEAALIEASLPLLSDPQISQNLKDFEAGKLHFKNFMSTPFANIIFSVFKSQFKLLMMNAHNIAGHVFNGMNFETKDVGKNSLHMIISNDYYPLDHFRGLFTAWMEYSGLQGTIHAREVSEHVHEYYFEWKDSHDTND